MAKDKNTENEAKKAIGKGKDSNALTQILNGEFLDEIISGPITDSNMKKMAE